MTKVGIVGCACVGDGCWRLRGLHEKWYNMQCRYAGKKIDDIEVRYSAAYPTRAERNFQWGHPAKP